MPTTVVRLPGEPIVIATVSQPFAATQDIASLYAQAIPLYKEIGGKVTLILDMRATLEDPRAFSLMMTAMAEASKGVQAAKTSGLTSAPRLILVGSGALATLASEAMAQEQYGGVKGELCATPEEAIARARGSA